MMNYSINKFLYFFTISLYYFYYFYPLINSGFVGDDIWNAQIAGQLIEEDISLLKRINNEWIGWLTGSGSWRITYYFIIYPLYYFTQEVLVIKFICIFTLMFNGIFIFLLLQKISKNNNLSFVAALIFPLFIQLRPWHDPVLGFPSYMMPLILLIITMSTYFFIKYQESNNEKYKWISLLLFSINLFMYDISVFFILIFILLSFNNNEFGSSVKKLASYFKIFSFYILSIFYFKLIHIPFFRAGIVYDSLNFHFINFTKAFLIQLSASLPLNYLISYKDKLEFFHSNKFDENMPFFNHSFDLSLKFTDIFLFIILTIIIFITLVKSKNSSIITKKTLLIILSIGLVFIVIPAFLSAVSGHQKQLINLGYGFAYIPVYLQYFGFLLITYAALVFVASWMSRINIILKYLMILLLSLSISIISAINFNTNNNLIYSSTNSSQSARNLMYQSLNFGILDELNEKSLIYRYYKYPSDYYRFYATSTGINIKTCELKNISREQIGGLHNLHSCIEMMAKKNIIKINTNSNSILYDLSKTSSWVLANNFNNSNQISDGLVYLAKINKIKINKYTNEIIGIYANKIKYYELLQNKITKIELNNDINLYPITLKMYQNDNIEKVRFLDLIRQ